MNKHEAKKIARSFTMRKTMSDVEALACLYEMDEKKPHLKLGEPIAILEKSVLGGNKGSDVVVFVVDINENIEECYKITPEESYVEPYRSLIDEWGSGTLRELIVDIIDNYDLDWSKEIECLAKKTES
jgi:hypothetical protein